MRPFFWRGDQFWYSHENKSLFLTPLDFFNGCDYLDVLYLHHKGFLEVLYLHQKSYLEVLYLPQKSYFEVLYLRQKSYLEVLFLQHKSYLKVLFLQQKKVTWRYCCSIKKVFGLFLGSGQGTILPKCLLILIEVTNFKFLYIFFYSEF